MHGLTIISSNKCLTSQVISVYHQSRNLGCCPGKELIKVEVNVRDNNVDQALRALKKKMQREGIFREMKERRHYEKPSLRKAREKDESIRRCRKMARKAAERSGF